MSKAEIQNRKGKIENWEHAEWVMEKYGRISCALAECQAALETELQAVRERHAAGITLLEADLAALSFDLRHFAQSHKSEFKPREEGGDVRSYEHAGVVIGYQRTPQFVRIRDEEQAVDWLRSAPWSLAFVRINYEPNREALRAKLIGGDERLVERLAAHGITLDQKDKFFLELK